MEIVTTINIRKDLLSKMISMKKKYSKSLNEIAGLLLAKALKWNKKSVKSFRSVRYQTKNRDIGFHKLHVTLDLAMYERCLDMRKLYKMSVSYILSACIQKYITLMLNEKHRQTDNYHDSYLFFYKVKLR